MDDPFPFTGHDKRAPPCSTDAVKGVPPLIELEGAVPPRPHHL